MRSKLSSHNKKCDPVPYIHTQLCRWWLWCWIKWTFCIFLEEKKQKRCLYVLNMSWIYNKTKTKTKNNRNPKNCQQLSEYFLALTSCPPSIKKGRRTEERGRIHNTWIINRFSSTAYGNSNTGGREGGWHLRRISETGKVTKLSLE